MHNDFISYFSQHLYEADPHIWIRTQFTFATTLVHEVAHAYSMWLGKDDDEPLWDRHDKKAELGFSWEAQTHGYICNPLFHRITGCEMLFSMKAISYRHEHQESRAMDEAVGPIPFHLAHMNPVFFQDLFQPQEYRGGTFYAGERSYAEKKWVIAIFALPLDWIMNWFREPHWEERHRMRPKDVKVHETSEQGTSGLQKLLIIYISTGDPMV
ncbi:hypothetical protein N0V90_008048 [Kalmusia sp. IMI 367209]|nr:hypothetical protein N0V90_008048 [Kalmusia sp. IMI 367209]